MFALVFLSVVLGIQIVYWLVLWWGFSKQQRARLLTELPPVSVVVCAHDEEQNLRELVPLLLQQDHPHFEVIVVDDRSNDGTYDFLLEATRADKRLRMVRVTNTPTHIHGKKFAITLAVKAATHDWLLLTDADCRPATNTWVRHLSAHMANDKKIVIGFSPYQRTAGLLNAFIRFETLVTAMQYIGFALFGRPYMGVGRNLAYRKSLFLEAKGFNDYLGVVGGDDDLFVNAHANSNNTAIALGPSLLVYSRPKTSVRAFLYQKFRHLSVGKRYHFSDRLLLGGFSLTWILTWLVAAPVWWWANEFLWIVVLFFVRWAVQQAALWEATRKLGEPFEGWKVPLLDFIYAFYYLVAGLVAVLSKKVRWRI